MLTQHRYRDELTIGEYFEEAWAQQTLADVLKENGYTVNLLIDKTSTYGSFDQLQNQADNIRTADGIKPVHSATLKYMRDLSFSRLVPYILKDFFLLDVHPAFGNELFEFVYNPQGSAQQPVVGPQSDLDFYRFIRENQMTKSSDIKVFNFVHLNSAHPSNRLRYDAGADSIVVEDVFAARDPIVSKRANFEILNVYFQQMREIGVYDNATIIVLGDHGRFFDIKEENPAVTTGLLIKPPSVEGRLERNTHSELSHVNFSASILEAAGISHISMGFSYFDIIHGGFPQTRYFTDVDSDWSAMGDVYEITGNAGDFANWRIIE